MAKPIKADKTLKTWWRSSMKWMKKAYQPYH